VFCALLRLAELSSLEGPAAEHLRLWLEQQWQEWDPSSSGHLDLAAFLGGGAGAEAGAAAAATDAHASLSEQYQAWRSHLQNLEPMVSTANWDKSEAQGDQDPTDGCVAQEENKDDAVKYAVPVEPKEPADISAMGSRSPGREERRWIEAAVRRMFRALGPVTLGYVVEAFREWKLPQGVSIVVQNKPLTDGPGLCVLFDGVVDVLHKPLGSEQFEKVCTYDRRGQVFGELELLYDVPRAVGAGRKSHWATIATRTPVTVWTVSRNVLRCGVPGASNDGSQ
jgi:hypothetical protein